MGELNAVYHELEHGAEIYYEELCCVPEEQVTSLVRSKEALGVFQPVSESDGPDYRLGEVAEEAERLLRESQRG